MTELADWCRANPHLAAMEIERLRAERDDWRGVAECNDAFLQAAKEGHPVTIIGPAVSKPDPRGPFFSTQWEREDYERRQRGEPELGPGASALSNSDSDLHSFETHPKFPRLCAKCGGEEYTQIHQACRSPSVSNGERA